MVPVKIRTISTEYWDTWNPQALQRDQLPDNTDSSEVPYYKINLTLMASCSNFD